MRLPAARRSWSPGHPARFRRYHRAIKRRNTAARRLYCGAGVSCTLPAERQQSKEQSGQHDNDRGRTGSACQEKDQCKSAFPPPPLLQLWRWSAGRLQQGLVIAWGLDRVRRLISRAAFVVRCHLRSTGTVFRRQWWLARRTTECTAGFLRNSWIGWNVDLKAA